MAQAIANAKHPFQLERMSHLNGVTNYKRTRRRRTSSFHLMRNASKSLLLLLCLQLAGSSFQSQRLAEINCQRAANSTFPAPEFTLAQQPANRSHAASRQSPLDALPAPQISAFDSVSLPISAVERRGRRQLVPAISAAESAEPAARQSTGSVSSTELEAAGADYELEEELESAGGKVQLSSQFEQQPPELITGSSGLKAATNASRGLWVNSSSSSASPGSTSELNGSLLEAFFSHIDKQWKFAEIVLIIAISATLNLVTIVGNIMVLISFKMDRSLQTVSNYFLLSLALADLLIGLISMPLYTLYLLLNYWPLGPLMCDIWLAIDYLNSNAAVLNMLIISFDRYFSVTRPLTYRAKRTTKHACLMISFAWLLSLTIWTPAIFTYPYYKGARTVQGTDKCEIEFVKANSYLTFVTAILAFYIPATIMIYLYWRIWLETKKRYRDLTTLFLVSGVGAAAPSRPTRPIISAITAGAGAGSAGLKLKSAALPAASRPRVAVPQRPGLEPATNSPARLRSSLKVTCAAARDDRKPSHANDQTAELLAAKPSNRKPNGQAEVEARSGQGEEERVEQQQQQQQTDETSQELMAREILANNNNTGANIQQQDPMGAMKAQSRTSCKCAACQHASSLHEARCRSFACKAARKTAPSANNCKQCRGEQLKAAAPASAAQHRELADKGLQAATPTGHSSASACYPCCCPYNNPAKCCSSGGCSSSSRQRHAERAASSATQAPLFDSKLRSGAPARGANCAACARSKLTTNNNNTLAQCCLLATRNSASQTAGKSLSHSNVAAGHSTGAQRHQQQQQSLEQMQFDKSNALQAHHSSSSKSIYQLISDAGHQRAKIHPKLSSSEQQVATGAAEQPSEEPLGFRNDEDELRQRQPVDAATSPIHFSTLNLMELELGQRPPSDWKPSADEASQLARNSTPVASNSPGESCEREDFETRIMSQGDHFRFESNDPKLIAGSRHFKEGATSGHAHHSWTTKHHHQSSGCCCAQMIQTHDAECKFCRPIVKPEQHFGQYGSRQRINFHSTGASSHQCHHSHGHHHHHHHHHRHHHRHQHNTHHHHRHNTLSQLGKTDAAKFDCKKCLVRSLERATKHSKDSRANKLQGANQDEVMAEQRPQVSLPILGALEQQQQQPPEGEEGAVEAASERQATQQQASNLQLPTASAHAKRTKYKKFSQKLTFSDILVDERSASTSDRVALNGGNTSQSDSVRNNSKRLRQLYDSGSSLEHDDELAQVHADGSSGGHSPGWLARGASHLSSSLARVPLIGSLVGSRAQRNRPVRYAHEQIRYRDEDLRRKQEREQQLGLASNQTRRKNILRRLCCSHERPAVKRFGRDDESSSSKTRERSSSSDDSNSNVAGQSGGRHQHLAKSGAATSNANNSSCKLSSSSSGGSSQPTQQHSNNSNYHHHHPIQPKSERKAAKTLSTLLLVFIVTWLPYNVLVLIKTLSGGEDQVPEKIWNFSYYLCYINSTINPLCYALCNAQFRRTYMRILKCKLSNDHASSTRRMVPIQSSNTWNKDLRLNSTWGTPESSRKSAHSEIATFTAG